MDCVFFIWRRISALNGYWLKELQHDVWSECFLLDRLLSSCFRGIREHKSGNTWKAEQNRQWSKIRRFHTKMELFQVDLRPVYIIQGKNVNFSEMFSRSSPQYSINLAFRY